MLKGRCLETMRQAETVWRLANAYLGAAPVARIVAWRSEALLEEWLPGLAVAVDWDGHEHAREAGFTDVTALAYRDPGFGYLGGWPLMFAARR